MIKNLKVRLLPFVVSAVALAIPAVATAQSWGTPTGAGTPITLDYAAYVNTVSAAVGTGITTAAPGLFLFMGAVVAFFFVWGRIRSIV